jgi:hypothetical protein
MDMLDELLADDTAPIYLFLDEILPSCFDPVSNLNPQIISLLLEFLCVVNLVQ